MQRLGRIRVARMRKLVLRHCEKRLVRRSSESEGGSDEAIHLSFRGGMDCLAALAMTGLNRPAL
jgi:hypothetical protein